MKLQNRHIILFLAILLASFYPVYRKFSETNPSVLTALFWVIILLILFAFGNRQIAQYLDEKYTWKNYKTKRLATQLIVVLIYSLICINLTYFFLQIGFVEYLPTISQLVTVNLWGGAISLPIVSIYYAHYFLQKWQHTSLYSEQLRQEKNQTQLETLQNYIDPAFSLKSTQKLAQLQAENPKLASIFTQKLTEIYQYVVTHRDQKPISLQEELEFIDAYSFILKGQFEDAVVLDINISNQDFKGKLLPPLVIQLLITNALKHNRLCKKNPLYIEILPKDENTLLVRNNLRRRSKPSYSPCSILAGIQSRYTLVTAQKVEVEVSEVYFTVYLPLISELS